MELSDCEKMSSLRAMVDQNMAVVRDREPDIANIMVNGSDGTEYDQMVCRKLAALVLAFLRLERGYE